MYSKPALFVDALHAVLTAHGKEKYNKVFKIKRNFKNK
jgi:hypothetical protein